MNVRNELEKRRKNERIVAIVCEDLLKSFRLRYYYDKKGKYDIVDITVPRKKPIVPSISDIFPTTDFYEREIHDFFGVEFEGNENLHLKLFLPDEFKGKPPLLKK